MKKRLCRLYSDLFVLPMKNLLVGLLLGFSVAGLAQPANLRLDRYNTESGLSQNLVYSIAQDKQGFLWFGTDEGLNRFDGYEFKTFTHVEGDSSSLTDNSIHSLLVDHTGILWVGTNNGISKYDPVHETFKNIPVDELDITKPNGTGVNNIREDSKGRVWVAYLGSGIDVFIPGEPMILHYTIHRDQNDKYRLPDDYVTVVEFLDGGVTLATLRSGLIFIRPDGLVMDENEAAQKFPWKNQIKSFVKSCSISRDKKHLWLGTETEGFYWVDLSTNTVKNFNTKNSGLLFNNNVPAILEDSHSNVWIGGEAIYLFDKKTNGLTAYNEFGMSNGIETKNPVLSMFEDKGGDVWIGTFRFGALKFNPHGVNVLHYHSGTGPGSLRNNQILSFIQDDQANVWIGTDGGGLYKMKSNIFLEEAPSHQRFSSQVIKSIYKDKSGNFWMGTWDGGLMKLNLASGDVEIFNPDKGNFPSRHVWDIQPDKDGNLWIATLRDGLCHFNTKDKTYRYFKSDPDDSTSLANNDVLSVFLDSDNILWVGTADGLSVLYPGTEKFINRKKNESVTNALCFAEDQDKRVWIGTNGKGILLMDKKVHVLKTLSEKDGLPGSTVCSLVDDHENNFWVGTYKGLLKINIKNFEVEEVPQAVGLQGKEFIAKSALRTSDGRLLFGGVNGFNMFHPDSLRFHPVIDKMVFTSLKVNGEEILPERKYGGKEILDHSITEAKELHLDYNDNSFTLSFSPLLYNWQKNIRFSYKLENLDPNWQEAEGRFLNYTSLDPGNYVLKIRAAVSRDRWQEVLRFPIFIKPPWWGTSYFRIFAVLLAAALLYLAYKTRVALLSRQKVRLEVLVAERTQALRKSNDEIQILLSELAEQKNQIEEQNHELVQTNNEVVQQRDALEVKSYELEKVQNKLKDVNSSLEQLVEKRTQKLSSTLRELETFLYRASHDLRGPISSMLGLLNVASMERDHQQLKQVEGFFHKSVLKLDQTLQRLLLKHTLERKKIVNEVFEYIDLSRFVEETIRGVPHFRQSDFASSIDEKINVVADRLILKTILVNLLENAFFFGASSENKKVLLLFQQTPEGSILEVKDFGCGIKPEQKDRIFEMFYRGSEISTGNGLGLYLVKSALDKINASIEFESEYGKFSMFRVKIPLPK